MRNPAFTLLLLPLLSITLTACAPSTPLSAMVHVRDANTGAPIANANVRGLGLTLFLPTSQEDMGLPPGGTLGPQPTPPATRGLTDTTGRTNITLAGNRPNTLLITAPGYQPLCLLVETGMTHIARPVHWSTGNPVPTGSISPDSPQLEARVSKVGPGPNNTH